MNAIGFFLILILFVRLSRIREIEKKQTSMMKDMENLITGYLLEMKEENEHFLNKFTEADQTYKETNKDNNNRFRSDVQELTNERSTVQLKQNNLMYNSNKKINNHFSHENSELGLPNLVQNSSEITDILEITKVMNNNDTLTALNQGTSNKVKDDLYIQSLSAQALLLQKKGYSLEEIARNLKKGKTEIELLLKFRQN